MKRYIPIILVLFLTGPLTLTAQKGIEDRSRFGHGEDSIRCVTNIAMYRELMRQKKVYEAAEYWEVVISECPYSTEMVYSDGIRMLKLMMENVKDPERRDHLFLRLMNIWDARIMIFGSDRDQKRKNLTAWKAIDLLKYKRDDITYVEKGYKLLQESLRGNRSEVSEVIIFTYLSVTVTLEKRNKLTNDELISNFRMINRSLLNNPDQELKHLPQHPFYTLIKSSGNLDEFHADYSSFLNSASAEKLTRSDIAGNIESEEQRVVPNKTYNRDRVDNQYVDSKRIALIIGNNGYEFGEELTNPNNDANSMAEVLSSLGFKVLTYIDLKQDEMRKAIDQFGEQLKEFDIGLFFYAGHGLQSKGFNYLIPVDALLMSENDIEYNCVRADRILGKMETAANKTNIVILDACRNNPFERSWTRTAQGKGLASMNAPSGSLIAFATSPGNTASDGQGNNGLYTSAILEYIFEPDLNIIQMFQKVRTKVRESSDGIQTPWESTSLEGDFYFRK